MVLLRGGRADRPDGAFMACSQSSAAPAQPGGPAEPGRPPAWPGRAALQRLLRRGVFSKLRCSCSACRAWRAPGAVPARQTQPSRAAPRRRAAAAAAPAHRRRRRPPQEPDGARRTLRRALRVLLVREHPPAARRPHVYPVLAVLMVEQGLRGLPLGRGPPPPCPEAAHEPALMDHSLWAAGSLITCSVLGWGNRGGPRSLACHTLPLPKPPLSQA